MMWDKKRVFSSILLEIEFYDATSGVLDSILARITADSLAYDLIRPCTCKDFLG